jgi:hypothetical protein
MMFLGGCGEVLLQQCPEAEKCNGVCCKDNEACTGGVCTACPGSQLLCGAACLDTSSDPLNCGACDAPCDATSTCSSGTCNACGAGMLACNNTCTETQTDENNCGMCGKVCDTGIECVAGKCFKGYFVLTGTPDPATVFNTIAATYRFQNNLTNSIWNRESNTILTGEFSTAGYWAFPEGTATYATAPDRDVATGIHGRMVQVPATNTAIYSNSPSSNGVGPATSAQFFVASISKTTGLLGTPAQAVFSDGHTAGCQLSSSSATHFLCYDGTGIRRYTTTAGTAALTYVDTVALSQALPAPAACPSGGACYGSTFAFDGAFFYFAGDEGSSTSVTYLVYAANGTYSMTYTASAGGAINGVYFDWSVGRYSTHDGYGGRTGTLTHGTGSDTHNFGAISTTHTLE